MSFTWHVNKDFNTNMTIPKSDVISAETISTNIPVELYPKVNSKDELDAVEGTLFKNPTITLSGLIVTTKKHKDDLTLLLQSGISDVVYGKITLKNCRVTQMSIQAIAGVACAFKGTIVLKGTHTVNTTT